MWVRHSHWQTYVTALFAEVSVVYRHKRFLKIQNEWYITHNSSLCTITHFESFHSFVHSAISIAPLQVLYYSEGRTPDYSTDTVSEFHAEAHRQLQVKDLPKVPTRRLERESNPRPSGWNSLSQPRHHHVPYKFIKICPETSTIITLTNIGSTLDCS